MTTKQDAELEGLEKDNTPEKNRLRVANQQNIEAYESARRSLERTPIGRPLNPRIPTDQLPVVSLNDWRQNGRREDWLILSEGFELVSVEESDEPTEEELKELEDA